MNIGNTTFNIYNTFLSVTGSIDSLTQNKQDLLTSTNLLNASYIGTGIINNTVFNYLSGVTSDIQTQFNSKQNLLSSTNLVNASYIGTGIINNTVFNYLSGVTSNIQTQLNNLQPLFLNNVSNTWTSNIGNYNYDFRRSDISGQNFYIGNSNTSTTSTSNFCAINPICILLGSSLIKLY